MTRTHGRNASERNNGESQNESRQNESDNALDKPQQSQPAHRLHLPGFITDEEIGLGDAIKRTSSYFGIKPCGGCERRAAALNRWLAFTPRSRK